MSLECEQLMGGLACLRQTQEFLKAVKATAMLCPGPGALPELGVAAGPVLAKQQCLTPIRWARESGSVVAPGREPLVLPMLQAAM